MNELSLVNTPQWAAVIKRLIRAEMTLHDVTYEELSKRLENQFGTIQTVNNLKAKINKGVLGAQLFVQILNVLGTESLDVWRTRRLFEEIVNSD
ncbi:MAG: hypothetical protein AMJ53_06555 [Gammaproteobacteria bacterium SG8_11]|nr:MAG: hypothetical protein AMJ53_06555 [Gammaproteobacteria bacterium SG8_11]